MDKKLKTVLKQSFVPPPSQHKKRFIDSIAYPKASFREVVISQTFFIRKRVWISFMLSVCFAFLYTRFMNVPVDIIGGISAILPFFSLCTAAEIYKSTVCSMEEMELACKYNLAKIMLMRIGVLGTVSFVMLALLVLMAGKNDFGLFRNTIYISVPYLLSSYLSLTVISKFRSKETIYVCAAISGAVSTLTVLASMNYQFIYHIDFSHIWIIIFIVLACLLSHSIIRYPKLQEEIQWNLL